MPAAPASTQARALSRVTPPRAKTGILCRHASRKAAIPATRAVGASRFSKTGAKTAKSVPSDAARATSAEEWHEIPMMGASGSRAPRVHTLRTSSGEMSSERRCTPSAPLAIATSVRELMSRRVLTLALGQGFSRTTRTAACARISSSRVGRSFSRN